MSKKKVKLKTEVTMDDQTYYFEKWWNKTACKKIEKIQEDWVKENEPNDPDEEEGGDHWCVNNLMHEDDPFDATYDIAKEVFAKGYNNEKWTMSQSESLYCDLDTVIEEAYVVGKKSLELSKKGKK